MRLLYRQNRFQHALWRGIPSIEKLNEFTITIDGDALSDQILFDHIRQRGAFHILRMAAFEQAVGCEIRLTPQLHDAFGDLVRMALFLPEAPLKPRRCSWYE